MRFLVDIYRYVVLGGLALAIVGIVYGALKMGSASTQFGAMFLVWGAVALVLVVMSLGAIATMISIHDRHAEIVDELRALRFDLESRRS